MTVQNRSKFALRIAITGALAAVMMTGATGSAKSSGKVPTIAEAQKALSKGKVEQAIAMAEGAVEVSPRDPQARLVLASAYLKAGRFDSAAATFNDAMDLGDNSARTALSLALANVAAGRSKEAVAILDDWRDTIPASDLGLALALAGESSRGVAILSDKLRSGENSPKLRQNLAYAYALDGHWREARTMMAEDVPADQIDARISDWAAQGKPEDYHRRVATLLSVPMRADSGQPVHLALSNSNTAEQLAVETNAAPSAPEAAPEMAVASFEPAPNYEAPAGLPDQSAPASTRRFDASFAAAPQMISNPVVQAAKPADKAAPRNLAVRSSAVPARQASAKPVLARAVPVRADGTPIQARPVASGGSHLVQLGAFSSAQGARRAWGILSAANPELRSYRMTITPAVVRGKNFWRVAAAGLDTNGAGGLCSTVKGRGGNCFAYAASNPPASGPASKWRKAGASGPAKARRK